MTIEQRDDEQALVRFDVVLENPNDTELVLENFDYRVGAGTGGFRAERRAGFTLPPLAVVPTSLPAVVPADALEGPIPINGRLFWFSREDAQRAFYLAGWIRPRTGFAASWRPEGP